VYKTTSICPSSISGRTSTTGDNIISHPSTLTIQTTCILAAACNGEHEPDDFKCTHVAEEFNAARKAYVKTKPWAPLLKDELSKTKLGLIIRHRKNVKGD
jgi:hypothetical protein